MMESTNLLDEAASLELRYHETPGMSGGNVSRSPGQSFYEGADDVAPAPTAPGAVPKRRRNPRAKYV